MPALQVALISQIYLQYFDPRCPQGVGEPFGERRGYTRGVHRHISCFLIILSIGLECAKTMPATIAAPTCSGSLVYLLDRIISLTPGLDAAGLAIDIFISEFHGPHGCVMAPGTFNKAAIKHNRPVLV
jgi:hypothetical protein